MLGLDSGALFGLFIFGVCDLILRISGKRKSEDNEHGEDEDDKKMSPIGSGLLPSDSYPDWLTFNSECSTVTFEVPQVDGRNLRMIMCIVCSSSPDNITAEVLKNVLVINCTKNIIQLYKKEALDSFNEEEWRKVVSNIEPGNKVKVMVVFENGFIVKKTAVYLIYEPIDEKAKHYHEPDKDVVISGGDERIFGRLFCILPSVVRAVLTSQPFWFGLAGILIGARCFSDPRRIYKPILSEISSESAQGSNNQVVREATSLGDAHEDVKRWDEEKE